MKGSILVGQAMAQDEENLWLVACHSETLLKIDWNTKTVVNGYQIPVKEIHEYGHNVISKCENKLYIFPLYSQGLFCFDIDKAEFEEIKLECEGKPFECRVRIAVTTEDKKIIFIDSSTNCVYDIDISTRTIRKRASGLLSKLKKRGINTNEPIFGWQHCCINNKLFIPIKKQNVLIGLDMNDDSFSVYELKNEDKILFIASHGKNIIMTSDEETEIQIDQEMGETTRELSEIQKDGGNDLYPFFIGDCKMYITYNQRRLYVEKAGIIKRMDIPYIDDDNRYPDGEYSQFEAIFIRDQVLYFQARSNGDLFSYNPSNNEICRNEIKISDQVLQSILNQIIVFSKKVVFSEDDCFSLTNFIAAV